MKCANCSIYPFCKKITKASDGCNEGIKRKLENEVNHEKGNDKLYETRKKR